MSFDETIGSLTSIRVRRPKFLGRFSNFFINKYGNVFKISAQFHIGFPSLHEIFALSSSLIVLWFYVKPTSSLVQW